MAPVYLVTGSSRGLGLEIVRQLLKQEGPECPTVVACARNLDTAVGLKELLVRHKHDGRLLLLQLDVDDKGSCQARNPIEANSKA
jgi:NAD(P)-dependent dehydrogenase (short-subunit alcohol dehydrogenase family)